MNTRQSLILLVVWQLTFMAYTYLTYHELPEKVATHFDASGHPNGWMSRKGCCLLDCLTSFGVALYLLGIGWVIKFFPPSSLNVPNSAYWRSPEHYPKACRFLFDSFVWMACLTSVLMDALSFLSLESNRHHPPQLNLWGLGFTIALFITGIVAWCLHLFRFFLQANPSAKKGPL